MKKILLVLSLLSLILAGCGDQLPTATPEPTFPPVVQTTQLRPTPTTALTTTLAGTLTTVSPTKIPPTSVPVAVGFKRWKLDQVVKTFKAAGLEIEPRTETDLEKKGSIPRTAIEFTPFAIASMGIDLAGPKGGRIFIFATAADLDKVKAYYDQYNAIPALKSWLFVKDNVITQINGDLPEAKAVKYQDALESMK